MEGFPEPGAEVPLTQLQPQPPPQQPPPPPEKEPDFAGPPLADPFAALNTESWMEFFFPAQLGQAIS
jgi:hypothetical protein